MGVSDIDVLSVRQVIFFSDGIAHLYIPLTQSPYRQVALLSSSLKINSKFQHFMCFSNRLLIFSSALITVKYFISTSHHAHFYFFFSFCLSDDSLLQRPVIGPKVRTIKKKPKPVFTLQTNWTVVRFGPLLLVLWSGSTFHTFCFCFRLKLKSLDHIR